MDIYNVMNQFSELKNVERRLLDRIISKSETVYEINLSKNVFLFKQGEQADPIDITLTQSADVIIEDYIKQCVFLDDQTVFRTMFDRENIIKAYYDGEHILECEYRRLDGDKYKWAKSVIHLFKANDGADIIGFTYMEDINEEKRKELELIYKSEHDLLTGLFNKVTAQDKIGEYLQSADGKAGMHALVMVDLDFFKLFNDNFGHAFGDAILSRKSVAIKNMFKSTDICGRVGGDEMIVFIKNIPSKDFVDKKLQQLATTVAEEYTQNGVKYKITASMGVSFYAEDGEDFDALYRHADAALYFSKEHGRNKASFYNAHMAEVESMVKSIDQQVVQSLNFNDNIIPYVFKILYESPNRQSTIDSVLALVGKHYNFSRAYVFEGDENSTYLDNTFEWCNDGIEPQIANLQKVMVSVVGDYSVNFNSEGIFYLPNVSEASDMVKQIFEPQNITSVVQFSIMQKDFFAGFIGFDQCEFARKTSAQELYELKNIANIVGVFILGMRAIERSETLKALAYSVVDSLNSYAYVIDPDTYELLFINERTHEIVGEAKIGQFCYAAFWRSDKPCSQCPLRELKKDKTTTRGKSTLTINNTALNVWVRTSASWIKWLNGKKACLIDCVDITEYIEGGRK